MQNTQYSCQCLKVNQRGLALRMTQHTVIIIHHLFVWLNSTRLLHAFDCFDWETMLSKGRTCQIRYSSKARNITSLRCLQNGNLPFSQTKHLMVITSECLLHQFTLALSHTAIRQYNRNKSIICNIYKCKTAYVLHTTTGWRKYSSTAAPRRADRSTPWKEGWYLRAKEERIWICNSLQQYPW